MGVLLLTMWQVEIKWNGPCAWFLAHRVRTQE